MVNKRFGEKALIPSEYLDTTNWATVNDEVLKPKVKEIYLQRKKAIDMYIVTSISVKVISDETGISVSNIYRLIERCLKFDELGNLWGYRALLPYKRLHSYGRQQTINGQAKLTGAFGLLLESYPSIKEMLISPCGPPCLI